VARNGARSMVLVSAPSATSRATASSNAASAAGVSTARSARPGTATTGRAGADCGASADQGRLFGSVADGPATTAITRAASDVVGAKIETVSYEGDAGMTPSSGRRPRVGLRPMTPLNAAGTRPDPAV